MRLPWWGVPELNTRNTAKVKMLVIAAHNTNMCCWLENNLIVR
jgi:hypothetical protein